MSFSKCLLRTSPDWLTAYDTHLTQDKQHFRAVVHGLKASQVKLRHVLKRTRNRHFWNGQSSELTPELGPWRVGCTGTSPTGSSSHATGCARKCNGKKKKMRATNRVRMKPLPEKFRHSRRIWPHVNLRYPSRSPPPRATFRYAGR